MPILLLMLPMPSRTSCNHAHWLAHCAIPILLLMLPMPPRTSCSHAHWLALCAMPNLLLMLPMHTQFDTSGEAIIITSHAKLAHYLGMLTSQLPIESQVCT